MNTNLGLIVWIIPLGMFLSFGIPHIQTRIDQRKQTQLELQELQEELAELKRIENPDTRQKARTTTLEMSIELRKNSIRFENKVYLQVGGMLVVLFTVLLIMGVSSAKVNAQNKNMVGFEQDVFDIPEYDPIAQKTSWHSLKSGGSNFVTHKVKQVSPHVLKVKRTSAFKAFGWGFLLIGLNYLFFHFYGEFQEGTLFTQGILKTSQQFFTNGGPFFLIGLVILFTLNPPSIFDKRKGTFQKGAEVVPLPEIYAVQLISGFVQGSGRNSGSFFSHELNLVLKDGSRINVMDHGGKGHIKKDALAIGKFLQVPVWNKSS
ncbi:hypothetical protein AAG747_27190 [Rapidithrix thailandica]|uniref:Uncharacterized protein n=1 Tax=Rapidithrix thailandica TaxID=413964 RepID=A0AAW9SII0_9BACT